MIGAIILTTNDIQDRHAYFEDNKFYLADDFDWKKFASPVLKIQVENGAMEDLYNQEILSLEFAFTCLRRFNEFYAGAVQQFDPNSLVLQGNCQEFPKQNPSIRNRLMDLIGWETTWDADEPKPIDYWQKKTGSVVSNVGNKTDTKTDMKPNGSISKLFHELSEEFEKVGM